MITLKEKYKNYKYSREVINSIYSYLKPQVHLFSLKEQNGGSIDKINKIIKKYSDIDIEVDMLESTDKEVRAVIFNLNRIMTCASLVINFTDKIAEIADLRSDKTCIKNKNNDENKKIMASLMHIIIGISKSSGMKLIRLSDHSYHNCANSKYKFNLDIANTITDGEPYYYKYGFIYEDINEHKIVKKNKEKLINLKTKDISFDLLKNIIIKEVKNKQKNINKLIEQVKNIYDKYLDDNIMNFFKKLKYSSCVLFSLIHSELILLLKLKYNLSRTKTMIFIIKNKKKII
jgi:hypothetical protein